MNGRYRFRNKNGFTLWEVMLVLMLLGVLAYAVIPDYKETLATAKAEADRVNVITINNAVRSYILDIGEYPKELNDLIKMPSGAETWKGPYLNEIPKYPLDSSLSYGIDNSGKVIVQ